MTTHGVDIPGVTDAPVVTAPRGSGLLSRAMAGINAVMVFIGMIALLIASFTLTYSVFSRYLFKAATDWQDEVAVFSIVGAAFPGGARGSAARGPVGVQATSTIPPPRLHRRRRT